VYSSTDAGRTAVTLRFYVGEDREDSLLNSYNKLYANQDQMPAVVSSWLVKPVEVDDVPIVVLGLWSDDADRYSDYELRRMADEFSTALQAIPQTSEVKVVGGRPRTLRVLIDPEAMAARRTTAATSSTPSPYPTCCADGNLTLGTNPSSSRAAMRCAACRSCATWWST
jgi:multidrug efflux pump subunit AcrB